MVCYREIDIICGELVHNAQLEALDMAGNGFGLGGAVTVDEILMNQPCSEGTFSWGGLASTFFWIDPVEDIIAIQMTQMMPSSSYPIRPQFQQFVYSSIIE